jgi:hypothetical protein
LVLTEQIRRNIQSQMTDMQLLVDYSSIDGDYPGELERHCRETLKLLRQDALHAQIGVLIRAERYERC